MVSSSVIRRDAAIKVLPRDILSMKDHLGVLDLAGNAITSIDEIGGFTSLRVLDVSRNALTYLPASLCQVTSLVELRANKNKIVEMMGEVHQLVSLKILDLSDNALNMVPTDVGWLPLDTLKLEGNTDLKIPTIVTQLAAGPTGIKALLSYLQVIGEQQRMVEAHLDQFSSPATPGQQDTSRPVTALDIASLLEKKQQEVTDSGVLDLKRCGTPALLGAMHRVVLPEVAVADVRYNQWNELPKYIMELEGLVVCNASHNNITTMTMEVPCAHLGILNLSFNKVAKLPPGLGDAPALEQLYLANNNLTDLPDTFSKLPLVDLFLSENPLSSVPKAVLGLQQLAKLSMACCRLTSLPPDLARIKTLRFLDASFNMITGLDKALAGLVDLSALNLAFNPLKAFPEVILSLKNLVECNLDYTGISTLPPGLGGLPKLEGLQLEGCPLKPPLDAVYAAQPMLVVQMHNPALETLDLSGLMITTVPDQLSHLSRLVELNLAENLIEALPAGQTAFGALRTLDASGNKLTTLPTDFCSICLNLQVLKLHTNALVALPDAISCLKKLQVLSVTTNRLTALPVSLYIGCTALTDLDVSANSLTELSHSIGGLAGLRRLLVNQNRLTWVPTELEALKQLREVSFDDNPFGKVTSGLSASSPAAVQKVLQLLLPTVGRRKGEVPPPPAPPSPPKSSASASASSTPPLSKESSRTDDAATLQRSLSAHRRAREAYQLRLAQDPVRRAAAISSPPDGSHPDAIPSLAIPRIVSFITTNRPPPPVLPPASASEPCSPQGSFSRPQTMARFKRVMDQTNMAKQILQRVETATIKKPPSAK